MRGSIFHLQRYSLHDGPGIRTVVFLSGCHLRCPWCCNPESREESWPDHHEVEAGALADELMVDAAYFQKSGGGVTLSGGEPLLQPEFCKALLLHCRERGLATAVETCGDVEPEVFASLRGLVDLYLFDLKHTDQDRHDVLTGGSFANILANLRTLTATEQRLVLRLPLIWGVNLDEDHARRVAQLAHECAITRVDLMPHHRLAEKKHIALGHCGFKPACDTWANPESAGALAAFADTLAQGGLAVTIGG